MHKEKQSFSALIDIYVNKYGDEFPTKLRNDLLKHPIVEFVEKIKHKNKDLDINDLQSKIEELSEGSKKIYDFLKSAPTMHNIIMFLDALKPLSYEAFCSLSPNNTYKIPFVYGNKGSSYLFNVNRPNITINSSRDVEILNNLLSHNLNNDLVIMEGRDDVIAIVLNTLLSTGCNDTAILIPKNDSSLKHILSYIIAGNRLKDFERFLYNLIDYKKSFVFPINAIVGYIVDSLSEENLSTDNWALIYNTVIHSTIIFARNFNAKVILYGEEDIIKNIKDSYSNMKLPISYISTDETNMEYNRWVSNAMVESKKVNGEIGLSEYLNYKYIINNKNMDIEINEIFKYPHKILSFDKVNEINSFIGNYIIGQEKSIKKALDAISVGCLVDKRKPISILLVGPTGVGKTMFGKKLADYFNVPSLQMDMSLFSLEHSLTNILGAPRSYVGYENQTPFEKFLSSINITSFPSGILILDEAEKAHPKIITSVLMPLLDGEGITFSISGKKVPYGLVVIATTNGDATSVYEELHKKEIGFDGQQKNPTDRDIGKAALENFFPPELMSRFHTFVEFKKLSSDDLMKIASVGFESITHRKPSGNWRKKIEKRLEHIEDGRNATRVGELVALEFMQKRRRS